MKIKPFSILTVLILLFCSIVFAEDQQSEPLSDENQVLEENTIPEDPVQSEVPYIMEQAAPEPGALGQQMNSAAAVFDQVILNSRDKNKITLDIKGMDVVDVLKMLANRSSMNLVIGKNVTGRATLFLKDVDVWDAFEIIILANDLAYEKKGGIINVMTQRDYELMYGSRFDDKKQIKVIQLEYAKAMDISKSLNQIKTNMGRIVVDEGSNTIVLIDSADKIKEMLEFIKSTDLPIQTRIFNLNYAPVDKLSAKLTETVTKGVGSIKVDERTNKIAITDYVSKLDEISKIITAFDDKTPQVLIDAQIIEVKPSDKFEMGIDWDYWIESHFKISTALPIGTAGRLLLGTPNTSVTSPGQYKGIIDLLQTIGDVKVLSSPRIMALNNQEAKIHVGTKDAYITSSTSQAGVGTAVTAQSVNFVDTGIQLSVTPTINKDGFVTMKIKPEVSSATRTNITSEGQITQIPIVTTSEAETAIMIKDGVTVIIGGLKKEEKNKTVNKIPWIGDIPYLGALFRSTSDEVKTTDLIILLTPHIMSGERSYSDFSQIKPQEGPVARLDKEGELVVDKINKPETKIVESKSSDYYKQVVDKISAWSSFEKTQGQQGEVQVSFVLAPDGILKYEPKIISSSNQKLNDLAIKSVKSSSPFPAFPPDMVKNEEIFRISLVYK